MQVSTDLNPMEDRLDGDFPEQTDQGMDDLSDQNPMMKLIRMGSI